MLTGKTQDVSSSQLDLYIQCNTNQNPKKCFVDNDKLILKFIGRGKRPRIANKILKYNNGEWTLPNFNNYCNATVIKRVLYWKKKRQMDVLEQTAQKQIHINKVSWSLTNEQRKAAQ